MAPVPLEHPWSLHISTELMDQLETHLFPGDNDEHGAVLGVGVARSERGTRLLARRLDLAHDGTDYVVGERGYRMLTPTFVRDRVLACAGESIGYLAVHCHAGANHVGFSADDLASHARGYPAIVQVLQGAPVGGVVMAHNAVAGDLWLSKSQQTALAFTRVVGHPVRTLFPEPPLPARHTGSSYDRQTRLFGDRGQNMLARQKVGIIGAGGAGSLIVEYLARLGVGTIVVIDPDRLDISNLPRVVGSRRRDARPWLTSANRPPWLQRLGRRLATPKVTIALRVARLANRRVHFEAIHGDVTEDSTARRLTDCDYLFLAADTHQARHVFNALVHQYLIPGCQVGAKVSADRNGAITRIFSVVRPITPDTGCLWCNGLINPTKLAEEALTPAEREHQRYVDDVDVAAPSVITLNAVAASHAVDHFMHSTTGLLPRSSNQRWTYFYPTEPSALARVEQQIPRKSADCIECGSGSRSRKAAGDSRRLPTRQSANP